MILAATHPILLGALLGGWEFVLMLAVMLILIGARHLPDLGQGLRRGIQEFIKAYREVARQIHEAARTDAEAAPPAGARSASQLDELILWVAQGLDVGRIPVAPGTFGSVVGLLWFAVLLVPGSLLAYLLGTLLGLAISVWCCGRAEKILGQADPGSVVLDEIVAMPICFLPWLISECNRLPTMPSVETFLGSTAWWKALILFGLFRLFDVAKPWPVRQSQALPGGWGVTADDVLAALYVALVSLLFVSWL